MRRIRLGWKFHRLWSTNWFTDPQAEVAKVRDAYERAVSDSAPEPAPPSAPGHDLEPVKRI